MTDYNSIEELPPGEMDKLFLAYEELHAKPNLLTF